MIDQNKYIQKLLVIIAKTKNQLFEQKIKLLARRSSAYVKVLSLFARIKIIDELALDQAILFF